MVNKFFGVLSIDWGTIVVSFQYKKKINKSVFNKYYPWNSLKS